VALERLVRLLQVVEWQASIQQRADDHVTRRATDWLKVGYAYVPYFHRRHSSPLLRGLAPIVAFAVSSATGAILALPGMWACVARCEPLSLLDPCDTLSVGRRPYRLWEPRGGVL